MKMKRTLTALALAALSTCAQAGNLIGEVQYHSWNVAAFDHGVVSASTITHGQGMLSYQLEVGSCESYFLNYSVLAPVAKEDTMLTHFEARLFFDKNPTPVFVPVVVNQSAGSGVINATFDLSKISEFNQQTLPQRMRQARMMGLHLREQGNTSGEMVLDVIHMTGSKAAIDDAKQTCHQLTNNREVF